MKVPTLSDLEAMLTTRSMFAMELFNESMRDEGAHAHAVGQLLGSSSGLLSVSLEQETWVVPATHCVWIPPHMVHKVHSQGAFSGWSVFINQELSRLLSTAH